MVDLKTFFERCYVVSLSRRQDRYTEFCRRLANWPFATVERWSAVDGQLAPPPPWWKAGDGAWGCYRSHAGIIEKCLNENVQSVLLLEDDALPCDGFTAKATEFLEHVPADWGMIYFGGQYLHATEHPSEKINDFVVRPYNVNRTHAFALSRAGMKVVYQHLHRRSWKEKHHIDHHLGRLHESQKLPVYCPAAWLIGQAEGKSNILGRDVKTRFWNGHTKKTSGKVPAVIAVVGPMRSGTSCTAGMLHKLGVSVGRKFTIPNKNNPKGFYEALELRKICWASYKEPRMTEHNTRADRVQLLRNWAAGRNSDGKTIGAKHPTLCLMLSEMLEAWPQLKVITTDRPVEEILASLRKASWWKPLPEEVRQSTLQKMLDRRDADLAALNIPTLRLPFADVIHDPTAAVDAMIAFGGLSPTDEQRAAAIAHVDPTLKHHGGGNE
jgi:hypothetical protein